MKAPEQRTIDVDVSTLDTRGRTVHGYAAVYGVASEDLGGFREQIAVGAFADVLGDDVRALLNHDPNEVLGRTRSGTLRLADDQRGLRFELDLPDSPLGENVREAVKRGDLDGASFRFEVGDETWNEDLRTVQTVKALRDVTLATYPAYPEASIELRTRTSTGGERRQRGATMAPEDTGADTAEIENKTESTTEQTTEEQTEQRTEAPAAGSLRVEQRASSPRRGLAEEFRAAGFPGEVASIPLTVFEDRAVTWSPSVDLLNQTDRQGSPFPADQRYAFLALERIPVDDSVTSVQVLTQTAESAATGVVRAINSTANKAEVGTTIDLVTVPLSNVAGVETGVPNIVLAQPAADSLIEGSLRRAVLAGLDSLVVATFAASGFQAPGSDPLPTSIRKAMTVLMDGYLPDTVILTPADAEALDTLVSGAADADADYVWGPGAYARDVFGLRKVISAEAPSSTVLDSRAYGKVYASPARLAAFEENSGRSNTQTVRLELNSAVGVEYQAAAVRIAAS